LKPRHQKLLRWFGFILAGVISLGALLDAVSNAFSVVTPRVTYVSSAIILIFWLLTELAALLLGIPWMSKSGQKVQLRALGPKIRFGIIGILILLWVPRLGDIPFNNSEIPPVKILLVNPTNSDIQIGRRGEFVLWLPTALYYGAPRIGGKFTFFILGEKGYLDSPITVKANNKAWVFAKLLGQNRFIIYLEREDTDLELIAQTNAGTTYSPNIPFIKDALTNRYLEWKIAESQKAAHQSEKNESEKGSKPERKSNDVGSGK
jgi:hypothetical protein